MIQFHIQPESEIPASTQLYNQIWFAIASRQYPPGHRLPSTRQLAQMTGLHRNTISKVYRQLEEAGVVESLAGSGIYVRAHGNQAMNQRSPLFEKYPQAHNRVKQTLDDLMKQGCSLSEAKELFDAEVDWRLRCSASILVTAPAYDIGAGQLTVRQLETMLNTPVQLVPLEELGQVLDESNSSTVVTIQYFFPEAEAIAAPRSVRVIPIDVHDYAQEIQIIQRLPKGSCLGLVSISIGLLNASEIIVHSLRGEDLLVMTALVDDHYKLNAIVRSAQTIFSDPASFATVKATIAAAREDLIRPPQLICTENYVSTKSINTLKRELGME